MNPIEECYASGKGTYVDTIEGRELDGSLSYLYCSGFVDLTCQTEDGRILDFTAMAMDTALPKNDNSGFQNIILALDNTTGEVQEVIEQSRESGKRFIITVRRYLVDDLSAPSTVFRMTLLSREYEDSVAKLTAGFFDLLNTNGMRDTLTTTLAPGLTWI